MMLSIGGGARHYISCPQGQVREETNIPPLSQLEGSNGGLWCEGEERVAAGKGETDSCDYESG